MTFNRLFKKEKYEHFDSTLRAFVTRETSLFGALVHLAAIAGTLYLIRHLLETIGR